MPLLTIASLTLREAVRRRVAVVSAVAALTLTGLSALGMHRLIATIPMRVMALGLVSALVVFLAFAFSVVLAVGASFLAAPAIAGDIESGIVLTLLPRPLSRTEYLLGKWLGLAALLTVFAFATGALEVAAVAVATGYMPPHPATALAYMTAQSIVLLSLALLMSTRLPAIASGLFAVFAFGVAWIAGIAASIAHSLNNLALVRATTAIGLLIPTDGLWRGAVNALTPVTLLIAAQAPGAQINPFGAATPPAPAFLWWSAGWVVAVTALAAASFERRDC